MRGERSGRAGVLYFAGPIWRVNPFWRPIVVMKEMPREGAEPVNLHAVVGIERIRSIIIRNRVESPHKWGLICAELRKVGSPVADVFFGRRSTIIDLGQNIVIATLQQIVTIRSAAKVEHELQSARDRRNKRKGRRAIAEEIGDGTRSCDNDDEVQSPIHEGQITATRCVIQRVAQGVELYVGQALGGHRYYPFFPPPPEPDGAGGRTPTLFVEPMCLTPSFMGFGCGRGGGDFELLSLMFVSVRVTRAGMDETGPVAAARSHNTTTPNIRKRCGFGRPLRIAA